VLTDKELGRVADLSLVRRRRFELPLEEVRGDGLVVIAIDRHFVSVVRGGQGARHRTVASTKQSRAERDTKASGQKPRRRGVAAQRGGDPDGFADGAGRSPVEIG